MTTDESSLAVEPPATASPSRASPVLEVDAKGHVNVTITAQPADESAAVPASEEPAVAPPATTEMDTEMEGSHEGGGGGGAGGFVPIVPVDISEDSAAGHTAAEAPLDLSDHSTPEGEAVPSPA